MARPKGSKNKVSAGAKAALAAFIDGNATEVQTLWDDLCDGDKKDKARALEIYAKLAEFVIPKLGRTEVTGQDGAPLQVVVEVYGKREDGKD